MTARLAALKAAHAASKNTQSALNAVYKQDTSNVLVWELFQTQVSKTVTLHQMVLQEIASPTPVPTA